MDFSYSDEQRALGDIAEQILRDVVTPERLTQLEQDHESIFDRETWGRLAEAGVLAAVVPEAHGGSGLGIADLVGVFEAAGKTVAPVPLVATLVLGALPIAHFGTPEQQGTWLPGVADGSVVLTAALEDPQVSAAEHRLSGEVLAVPYAQHADRILVPTDGAVYLVDPSDAGVTLIEQLTTNRQPQADLVLEGAAGELLTDDPSAARWIAEHGAAAVCAVQAGICEGALRMTATHTSTRRQFDKPIAEFQAVAQRAADAFIDTEMVRLTAWQALFRLSQGWPATNEVHVAKFWAGDGGMRALHAAQHLHGGLGVDTSYPLHRYFLWGKQNEHTLGTPTRELIRLGNALADEPV
jgi:alkylation response protein AidB-like acyl-CoA dehydrogenase